jgi:hypothetical protein
MKRLNYLVFVLAFCILFTACAPAASSFMSNGSRVQPSQTTNDVVAIMGRPQQSQTNGQLAAWQYCVTDYSTWPSRGIYQIVWFSNSVVYGTSSYNFSINGSCESFFRTIDWNSPDISIEIK